MRRAKFVTSITMQGFATVIWGNPMEILDVFVSIIFIFVSSLVPLWNSDTGRITNKVRWYKVSRVFLKQISPEFAANKRILLRRLLQRAPSGKSDNRWNICQINVGSQGLKFTQTKTDTKSYSNTLLPGKLRCSGRSKDSTALVSTCSSLKKSGLSSNGFYLTKVELQRNLYPQ